ncbi:MAG: leucyl aminopeptidase [Thiotrichales bacterium]
MALEYSITSGNPEKQRTPCVIVPVFKSKKLSRAALALDDVGEGFIKQFMKTGDIEGEIGDIAWLYQTAALGCDRVMLVGCGAEREVNPANFKKICDHVARALNKSGAVEAVSYLASIDTHHIDEAWMVRETVLSFENSLYRFEKFKSKPQRGAQRPLRRLTMGINRRKDLSAAEQAMREGMGIATGMRLAKDLANHPPNVCNPSFLVEEAYRLQKIYPKLEVEVIDESDMAELGLGAFLAVSRGSEQPGKLIGMRYNAAEHPAQPITLVGKGITFDTGGISLKPAEAMDEMKFDMGGAASVFGTLVACMDMQLPVHVVGIVAAAENMPSGKASRPGDIVTTLSGQTVEILNTDAEGRLVLCDALAWAKRYDPDVVIDIATLTGACIIALGHQVSALMTNNSPLGRALLNAGQTIDDRAWELPLFEDYQEPLKSNFADMANIGGRPAGAITAAAFLSRFTKDYRWAHLDIAGTAWRSGEKKGATGRPVPLLMEYILRRAKSD